MLILIFTRTVLQIFKYCGRVDTYLNISVLRTTAPGKDRNPQQKIPRLSLFLTNSSQMTLCLSHPDPSISSFIVNCCFILIVLSDILRCWIDVSSIEIGRMWIAVFGKPIVEYIWKLLTYSGNEGFCKRKVFMDFS